ncbi:hypothetical protein OHA_1_01649 [Pleomorphomonas sp. SM30]|nr:hypothetical protein OHA_1_01649 [Pleomorphomonas sp. SM30]
MASVAASAPSARTSRSSIPSPAVPTRVSMAATSRAVVRCSEATSRRVSGAVVSPAVPRTGRGFQPAAAACFRRPCRLTPIRRAIAVAASRVSS